MKLPEAGSGRRLLIAWFERTGCAKNMFAETVGISPPMVNEWLSEDPKTRSIPKASKRKLIARATNGDVPEASWETKEEREALANIRPIMVPKGKRGRAAAGG